MKEFKFLVRRWQDPYNERGEYRQSEVQVTERDAAITLANVAQFDRAIVLDVSRTVRPGSNSHPIVYRRG